MAVAISKTQLQLFLDHVELPAYYRNQPPSAELLTAIHVHVISTLPYENLTLHYDPAHYVDLDPQHLFQKIVVHARGRGGFCMENAILYNHVLRAMGFDAYTAGVRTRLRKEGVPEGNYPGWSDQSLGSIDQSRCPLTSTRAHIVNIVTLPDGSRYQSDVAFGGDGPTIPMPMVEGLVHLNLGTQQIRLVRDWLPDQVHRVDSSRQWIYQYRNSETAEWNSFYAFTEVEFLQPDWGVLNHWVCSHPDSNQLVRMLIVSFQRRRKEGGAAHEYEIVGKRMLVDDVIKENLGGKTSVVKQCRSEDERVQEIRERFGITLTQEERAAIAGRQVCLA